MMLRTATLGTALLLAAAVPLTSLAQAAESGGAMMKSGDAMMHKGSMKKKMHHSGMKGDAMKGDAMKSGSGDSNAQ